MHSPKTYKKEDKMVDFAREISLKTLYKIDVENGYTNIILDENLNKYRQKLNNKDINLISEIVYGAVSRKLTIDCILQKYSKIKLKKMSSYVLNILRISAYQILFLDKIPKSAAVNEGVNLAKKYAYKSTSFINAILRKIEKTDLEDLKNITNDIERISKVYSIPVWLVEELSKEYSMCEVENICKNSNEKPKTTIRINTLKTNENEFLKLLNERNIEYEKTSMPNFINIKNLKNIAQLDLFKNGLFTVQDLGAGKISITLSPNKNDIVLDACSAPGGKTTHLAEIMENKGVIIACDLYEHRLEKVRQNSNRLGINIIQTKLKNMSEIEEKWNEKFDKILLDVPCLGFGVMKRKPDIKWQRKKQDIDEITKIQFEILNTCSKYLKKGGELVYSTCSILKNENEDIVNNWIKKQNNKITYKIISMEKILPSEQTDGFFISKIRKIR